MTRLLLALFVAGLLVRLTVMGWRAAKRPRHASAVVLWPWTARPVPVVKLQMPAESAVSAA